MAQLEETALPALTPRSELLASLEKHNAQFTTLLSLIPAQFYIQPTQEEADSKWLKNKKRKTGEEIKENKRKNLSEKLDPSKQKTTADILFAADPSFTGMDVDTPSTSAGPSKPLTAPLPPTTSISDLRKRLAGKLAGFRSKRGIDSATGANSIAVNGGGEDVDGSEGEDEGESDDTGSRDALEAESRRRRGEMRDKRRRDRKEARRAEKAQNGSAPTGDKKKGQDVNGKARDQSLKNVPTAKTQLIVPQHSHGQTDSLTLPHIALPSGSKHGHKHTKGSIAPGTNQDGAGGDRSSHFKHLSNPAHALANLQKHDQNLASMSDDKRAEAVEQERWAKALHRAEGGKIVDSERILKKAVKRVEKHKSKSGKEWADRKKQLSDAQAAAIKKRNDNLAGRAQARKDKKSGVKKKDVKKIGGAGAKKGKSRPGFEGKKGGGGDKGKKGGK